MGLFDRFRKTKVDKSMFSVARRIEKNAYTPLIS